jgi:hypothetical protein
MKILTQHLIISLLINNLIFMRQCRFLKSGFCHSDKGGITLCVHVM